MEKGSEAPQPLAISERDPLHWALNELSIRVVDAMLKELGVSETLSIVRPRIRYSGRAMARNFASRFNLDSGGLEAIAFAPFCARCLTWGGKGRLTFYERGAINEFVACPMSHGPPEICIMLSHYVGEGASEEINPDFEMVYTHHMTQGDPSCTGVCRRKGELGIDAEHLGKRLKVVDGLDIDEQERDALSFNIEAHLLNVFLECFLSAASADRVSQLLRPTFRSLGEETGRRLKAVEKDGTSAIPRSMLLTWGEMLGHEHDVKEIRESALELAVPGCVYCRSPELVCELMESFHAGIYSIMYPDASLRYTKCKEVTCDACKIVCQPRHSKDEGAIDPLVALKMRFVRGEISEEEYRRKREILLER